MMRSMLVTIQGRLPLLMHSSQTANPMNIYTKAIKAISSKRQKTDDDYERLARIEWEAGLYFDEEGHIAIPGYVMEAALRRGATANKRGRAIDVGARVAEEYIRLRFPGDDIRRDARPETIDDIPSASLERLFVPEHIDSRIVNVDRKRIMRTRPRFDTWSCEFSVIYRPDKIDERHLVESITVAGDQVGICDFRPRYGLFDVINAVDDSEEKKKKGGTR